MKKRNEKRRYHWLRCLLITSVLLMTTGIPVWASTEMEPEETMEEEILPVTAGEANVSTGGQLTEALADTEITTINISGKVTYTESMDLDRAVTINVPDQAILVLEYRTVEGSISTACDADIVVASGGHVEFVGKSDRYNPYFIMNGSFSLDEGATAKSSSETGTAGGVLFQGDFSNNGVLDLTNASAYLKWGTTTGTIQGNHLRYNLCIHPEELGGADWNRRIQIESLVGDLEVGSTLQLDILGFGVVEEDGPTDALSAYWMYKNGGLENNYCFTIPASMAGRVVKAYLGGLPDSNKYGFYITNDQNQVVLADATNGTQVSTASPVEGMDLVYMGGFSSQSKNDGASPERALQTISSALIAVKEGGTVVVCGTMVDDMTDISKIDKSVTFTNTDGMNTYENARLTIPCPCDITADVTFKDIMLKGYAVSTRLEKKGVLNIKADDVSITFDNTVFYLKEPWQLINPAEKSGQPYANTVINVKNSKGNLSIDSASDTSMLNLDQATVTTSYTKETTLGNVTLSNNSNLVTSQRIGNIKADNTKNTLTVASADPITITGDVVIASTPITVDYYASAKVKENQVLIQSQGTNPSLTVAKFKPGTTINDRFLLKKTGDTIVTAYQGPHWVRDANGYRYFNANRTFSTNKWQKIGSEWYRFGTDSYMKTGWQKISGKWYYFKSTGKMAYGWQKIYGKWYYLSSSKNDGSMKTGWQNIGGYRYYLGSASDGSMKTGWIKLGGKWYYLYPNNAPSGHMAKNTWIGKYYVNNSGVWNLTK